MSEWMVCTTCGRTVLVNETGTCLRCMRGFGTEMAEDDFKYIMDVDRKNKLKENIDALEERIEKVSCQRKHTRVKEIGKETKPSRSNRPPNCS